MLVISACLAAVLTGIGMVVRWGARPPAGVATGPPERGGRSVVRTGALLLAAGALAGLIAAGAGGRLVMRLLALTSPDAQGMLTEAEATIGEITVAGTLGFLTFAGVPAGVLTSVVYALVRPALPAGRLGGALLGALVLVLVGATIEPLRPDNFDFALVGPRWLAVLLFAALAVFQGMLLVAVAGRLAVARPAGRLRRPSARTVVAGRVVIAVVVAIAAPGFVTGVLDILA